jgi:hypothetical protein
MVLTYGLRYHISNSGSMIKGIQKNRKMEKNEGPFSLIIWEE